MLIDLKFLKFVILNKYIKTTKRYNKKEKQNGKDVLKINVKCF